MFKVSSTMHKQIFIILLLNCSLRANIELFQIFVIAI